MKKKFTYTRPTGYIEFSLVSKPSNRIRIYSKESKELVVEPIDVKMFNSYKRMGLVIEDIFSNDEPTVSVIEEPIELIIETQVEAPVDEPVEVLEESEIPVEEIEEFEEVVPDTEPEESVPEDYSRFTKAELIALANERGIELPNKVTKPELIELLK